MKHSFYSSVSSYQLNVNHPKYHTMLLGEECNTEYYANPGDEGGCLPYSFTTNLAG